MQIILASRSPRRRELLLTLGLEFEVITGTEIDESRVLDDHALAFEQRLKKLALVKGAEVSQQYPDGIVISADTVVADGTQLLGKPSDPREAARMIGQLSGKTHRVYTAIGVQRAADRRESSSISSTAVTFHSLSHPTIEEYVRRENTLDKAGGYAIQGLGSLLVKEISGDYSTVVGLPLGLTCKLLEEFGVSVL